ncbi:MAG: hypothetical protein GY780_09025 [bacterium]|nr:hypothetical protein [bacterium]
MKKSVIALLAGVLVMCLIPLSGFAQTAYTQDFESLSMTDGQLAADGWLVYGNIFDPSGGYLWGHGPWPAPNNLDPGNWCDIVVDQGGPAQEMQQLVVYSDYGNVEHASGNLVESNLFQEQVLPGGVSGLWTFTFDAKKGNLAGNSTALAFIKILNPADWSSTMHSLDMTGVSTDWNGYSLSVDVSGLDGMYLQFGFASTATNYDPCGMYYDNIAFTSDGTVATESTTLDNLKALYR